MLNAQYLLLFYVLPLFAWVGPIVVAVLCHCLRHIQCQKVIDLSGIGPMRACRAATFWGWRPPTCRSNPLQNVATHAPSAMSEFDQHRSAEKKINLTGRRQQKISGMVALTFSWDFQWILSFCYPISGRTIALILIAPILALGLQSNDILCARYEFFKIISTK